MKEPTHLEICSPSVSRAMVFVVVFSAFSVVELSIPRAKRLYFHSLMALQANNRYLNLHGIELTST